MPEHDLAPWRHEHRFDDGNIAGERSTRAVMWITALMMLAEVAAGWWFNSMALLADGFHMSSHAVAIGLSAFAYAAARRHAGDARYAFGTWKIEVLGGFASALFLLGVVALMVVGSVERLLSPQTIHYQEAIFIAVVGLVVNGVSAWLLGAAHHHGHDHGHTHGHTHGHDHGHAHDHGVHGAQGAHGHHAHAEHADATHAHEPHAHNPHHHDLNLRSAYVHVLADAATSVLAIVALLGGWLLGWAWLDPVMGIVGAVVVAVWAKQLVIDTSKILLDREMDHPVVNEIREAVEEGGQASSTRVTDLHVWRVGKARFACAVSLVTHDAALTPAQVRSWLAQHEEVVHATIEIHRYGEKPEPATGHAQACHHES
jgi:cation diffusion facilitator family transporter